MLPAEKILRALAVDLRTGNSATRLEAAQQLLERAENDSGIIYADEALVESLVDDELHVRLTAARALVRHAWGYDEPIAAALLALEANLQTSNAELNDRTVDLLVAVAPVATDFIASAQMVLPLLIETVRHAEPGVKSLAMKAIGELASYKTDLSSAIPALIDVLSDNDWEVAVGGVRALGIVASRSSTDLSAAVPALEAGLIRMRAQKQGDSGTNEIQYYFAGAMAQIALNTKDRALIDRLLQDPEPTVREGAMAGFAASKKGNLAQLVGVIDASLTDTDGTVVYYAIRVLERAVRKRIDLAPCEETLKKLLKTGPYSVMGLLEMNIDTASDLVGESLGADVSAILAAHYVQKTDRNGLLALLKHRSNPVRSSAREKLEQMATAGKNAARQNWIRGILR